MFLMKEIVHFIILLCLSATIACSHSSTIDPPQAKNAILDLSHWDLGKNGPVALNGQWEFFWHQLITPQMLNSEGICPNPAYSIDADSVEKKYFTNREDT